MNFLTSHTHKIPWLFIFFPVIIIIIINNNVAVVYVVLFKAQAP